MNTLGTRGLIFLACGRMFQPGVAGGRTLGYEQSSFKRNARDTEMTTRVTKGTRRERVGPI